MPCLGAVWHCGQAANPKSERQRGASGLHSEYPPQPLESIQLPGDLDEEIKREAALNWRKHNVWVSDSMNADCVVTVRIPPFCDLGLRSSKSPRNEAGGKSKQGGKRKQQGEQRFEYFCA